MFIRRRFRICRRPDGRALLGAVLVCAACGGGAPADRADQEGTGGASEVAGAETSRIPLAPTAEDALPPAVLGAAPPLRGQDVAYFADDPATRGYLAVPEGAGPFPAVILIHEWNGLVQRVKEMADALAAEGYVALAADLYSGEVGSNPEENMALVQRTQANPDRIIGNLDAAASLLRSRDDVTGRIGAMGWCFGGGIALSYALGGQNHEATAIFYGRLLDDPARLGALSHPVYGTFVREDEGIPVDQVDRFVATLRELGVPNDVHIYDDVRHGFWLHVDQDPERRSGPALDAWKRLRTFLAESLAG